MNTFTVVLVAAAGALLSGCVAYPDDQGPNYGGDSGYSNRPVVDHGRYDSSGRQYRNRDRDGDGVRNRDDRSPDDARSN